jgi:hypothetical protein
VKRDHEAEEVDEDDTEYRPRFWKLLLRAVPNADGISGGTSPPGVKSMYGDERALLAEEIDGELYMSEFSHSSLQ